LDELRRKAIEKGLLPRLLWDYLNELGGRGWEVRIDVGKHLDVAAAAAVSKLPKGLMSSVAQTIDDSARELVRDHNFDDPRIGLMACVYFILKLVEEGLYDGVRDQAVLVSLLLADDQQDLGGELPGYSQQLELTVGAMLLKCQSVGLYRKTLDLPPVQRQSIQ
jgi:hypothetical protein